MVTRYRCNGIIFFFFYCCFEYEKVAFVRVVCFIGQIIFHMKTNLTFSNGTSDFDVAIIRFLLYTALLDYVSAESNGHENIVNNRPLKKLLIVKQSLLFVS